MVVVWLDGGTILVKINNNTTYCVLQVSLKDGIHKDRLGLNSNSIQTGFGAMEGLYLLKWITI